MRGEVRGKGRWIGLDGESWAPKRFEGVESKEMG